MKHLKNILLLSNSTMPGEEYFSWPKQYVRNFLGDRKRNLLFIPYAGITISHDEYFESVSNIFSSLGHSIESIHRVENKRSAVEESEGIVTGGGNTFHLLTELYRLDLIDLIKEKVERGIPYIGWSAGSNICCPTIMTTNDMPVTQPPSFQALGLVPFQINPHYTEATIPNHGGESREMRLREFTLVNQDIYVAGLREGSLLEIKSGKLELKGEFPMKVFRHGNEPVECLPGEDINWLLKL